MIYLDYHATTPLLPQACEAMESWLCGPYNASSQHAYGRKARAAIEQARAVFASALETTPANILFTASGTEANTQALRCTGASELIVSAIEHASVLRTARAMAEEGMMLRMIPVLPNGVVNLAALGTLLDSKTTDHPLVSLMLANNETGVIQPVAEAAEIVHNRGGLLHCDASQAFGKIPFTLAELGADFVTLSGHKCGGPVGAAALVTNGCYPVQSLLYGGGQESNRRAGTENVAAIMGFARAVEEFSRLQGHYEALASWRDAFEDEILSHAPDACKFGANASRLPTVSCLAMPGVESATQLMDFDLQGIAVSAGSACTSGKVERSHVLAAMDVPPALADCALRVSGGWDTKHDDLKKLAQAWKALYDRVKKRSL